jgi:hypothetical protein
MAAAADEGELAALLDDSAQGRREPARAGAVDDHFGDAELAGERLALRFPIDGAGEAFMPRSESPESRARIGEAPTGFGQRPGRWLRDLLDGRRDSESA